jgi:hypothetical protein
LPRPGREGIAGAWDEAMNLRLLPVALAAAALLLLLLLAAVRQGCFASPGARIAALAAIVMLAILIVLDPGRLLAR